MSVCALAALALLPVAPASASDRAARMQHAAHRLQGKLQAWTTCLAGSAHRFGKMEDSVDLVISAAFGECSAQEAAVKAAYLPVYTLSHPSVDTVAAAEEGAARETSTARDRLREQLVGLLLRERSVRPKAE